MCTGLPWQILNPAAANQLMRRHNAASQICYFPCKSTFYLGFVPIRAHTKYLWCTKKNASRLLFGSMLSFRPSSPSSSAPSDLSFSYQTQALCFVFQLSGWSACLHVPSAPVGVLLPFTSLFFTLFCSLTISFTLIPLGNLGDVISLSVSLTGLLFSPTQTLPFTLTSSRLGGAVFVPCNLMDSYPL